MKANQVAAALAVVGAGVQAQSSQPVSYTTVTYDTCPTSVVASLVTITNGVTVTYCPLCDQGGPQPTGPPGGGPPPPGGQTTHTTVYTTVYEDICPTGVTTQTYTITESCTGPTPTWNTDSNHIPPDFTTTVQTCHVCDSTPVPMTITKPCGCKASEGVPIPPNQATPTPPPGGAPGGGNGNGSPNGGSGSGSPGGGSGSGSGSGQCPGPQCKGDSNSSGGSGSGAPGGGSNGSGAQCPGPQCQGGSGSGSGAPGGGSNNGGSGSPSGGNNNGTAPGCPGPQCQNGMSTAPAAPGSASGSSGSTPTSGPNACPGPQCKTSPSPQPYTGSASNFGAAGIVSTLFVAAVAALAFGL